MRKIFIFIITLIVTSCLSHKKFSDEQKFVDYVVDSAGYCPDVLFIIPYTGCDGCISYTEEFFKNNKWDERILFVFVDVISKRLLKDRIGDVFHRKNIVFLDSDNIYYEKIISPYPQVLYLQKGRVNKVGYQNPENDEINKLIKYLEKKAVKTIRLRNCLDAPDNFSLIKKILIPVDVIQLESEDVLNISKNIYVDSVKYAFSANNKIYLFNRQGAFLQKIGRIGKGPKEYFQIDDFTIVGDSVYLLTNAGKKLLVFTLSNKFLYSYPLAGGALQMQSSPDKNIIFIFSNPYLKSKYADSYDYIDAFSISKRKIVRSIHKKTDIDKNKKINMFIAPIVYNYNNKILFKEYFNDTIKEIIGSSQIFPYMVLTAGKYTAPVRLQEDINFRPKLKKYFSDIAFWESGKFLFVSFYYNDQKVYTVYDKIKNTFPTTLRFSFERLKEHQDELEKMRWIESVWPGRIFNEKVFKIFEAFDLPENMKEQYNIDGNGNPCIVVSTIQ